MLRSGVRDPYTAQESADLKRCLKGSSTLAEASRKFNALVNPVLSLLSFLELGALLKSLIGSLQHPRRTIKSVGQYYKRHPQEYGGLLPKSSRSSTNSGNTPENRWSSSEENKLVRLFSQPYKSKSQVYRAHCVEVSF